MTDGAAGLLRDKTRPSRIAPLAQVKVDGILVLTKETPPHDATHWTGAAMAQAVGVSVSSVHRLWRSHGLQPHRLRLFKLSNDPALADKLRDVVGLHMDPPAHAVVPCVDERSQVQALGHTRPGRPLKKGRCGTMTRDDRRNGTTTLLAALSVLDGRVIERDVPADEIIPAIVDNDATHKPPKVKEWLMRHPRWTFHVTPTSSSWLNAVEGYLARLTRRRLKRGAFQSVADLQTAMNRFIKQTNEKAKPFVWTKDPDKIIAAVKRGHQALDSIHWLVSARVQRFIHNMKKASSMVSKTSTSDIGVAIIGAGHAGGRAAQQLRAFGYSGKITLIGNEHIAPYERPPLSKGVLLNAGAEADAFLFEPEWYSQNDVTLLIGKEVTGIDRDLQTVRLSDGIDIQYDSLIIATGGRLRRLEVPGAELENIFYLKTMPDAVTLRARLTEQTRLIVIGGGFIGLEVAASARTLGANVTVVEATERLMGRAVPPVVSTLFKNFHSDLGIEIITGQGVARIQGSSTVETVVLDDRRELSADIVVIGVGITPETGLAVTADLDVDNGIVVKASCQTSDPKIFAIGDVACCRNEENGRSIRTESWQNAEVQAACAAAFIAGTAVPKTEPLWFWSDQHDVNLQIVGRPSDWNDLLVRGTPGDGPLVLFKMQGDRVHGAIGINAKRDMLLMRKLLTAGRPIDRDALTDTQIPLKKTVLNAVRT